MHLAKAPLALTLVAIVCAVPSLHAAPLIIDHTSVELYDDIPQAAIDRIKALLVDIGGETTSANAARSGSARRSGCCWRASSSETPRLPHQRGRGSGSSRQRSRRACGPRYVPTKPPATAVLKIEPSTLSLSVLQASGSVAYANE